MNDPDHSHEFWEASSLHEHTARRWLSRVNAYSGGQDIDPVAGAGGLAELRPVRDRLQRLLHRRRSQRSFGTDALRHRSVERILAATGPTGDGRRVVPEAGSLDCVHVFALARHVEGPYADRIVRYDHRRHAVADVAATPTDDELRELFLFDETADLPQALIVLILDPRAVTDKYGDRGTRFALQQVGHASQNILLRLAADRLRGYPLGGGQDAAVLAMLGLSHTRLRYGGAIACGR